MLRKLMQTDNNYMWTILRLTLGIVMFPHGAQKMLGWYGGPGPSGFIDFMASMGIPALIAWLIIIGEFFGSLGLIVGFLSRIAAAGIGIIMLGAVFMVHLEVGFFMNWTGQQAGEGYEYHLLVLGIALVLLIKGSGALSVDRALTSKP